MTPTLPPRITAPMFGGAERLESRLHRTVVTGRVVDTIRWSDGSIVHAPLADRIVYEDLNANGKPDPAEPTSTTDLAGHYKLKLGAGTYTLRLQEFTGWKSAGAGTDFANIDTTTAAVGTAVGTAAATATGTAAGITAGPTFSTKMIQPTRIDVIACYTPAARAGRSGHDTVAALRELFRQADQVYANSDTNVVLNPVMITTTAYRESGDISTDLDHLSSGDGPLATIAKQRDATSADVQVLFTSGDRTPGNDIGLSYEFTADTSAPDFADAVVALQGDDEDGTTLAHEIGHVLGAGHDKPNNDGPGVTPYAYGYHFIAANGRTYQDVMDYSNGIVLPFFSTPRFSWLGHPLGNAKSADNARIIKEDAPDVAAYR